MNERFVIYYDCDICMGTRHYLIAYRNSWTWGSIMEASKMDKTQADMWLYNPDLQNQHTPLRIERV